MLDRLPKTIIVFEEERARGHHLGAQIYVQFGDDVIVDTGWGETEPGVEMTSDAITLWMSSTKPIVAVAFAQLWEKNLVAPDTPVIEVIPEFNNGGKAEVTFHHILTHTGGFRNADVHWDQDPWETVIAKICRTPLEPGWQPGHTAGYHVATGWYILAEAIQRLTHRPLADVLRTSIFAPLGMDDSWIGIPAPSYYSYEDRIAPIYDATKGLEPHEFFNSESGAAIVRPGGNGRGPIRELATFYRALRDGGELNGQRILKPQTIEALVARHRIGLHDQTFRHKMDWGLGFVPNSALYGERTVPYGYGPHASSKAFGHSGWQSSCAFVDPEHQLVIAWVCNGTPGEPRHHRRQRAPNTAIYEDLGLT
jgi:CubicO group peptidase (beta-lactamase class C family)